MRRLILVTVCVLIIACAAYVAFRHVDRTHAQPARDLSKMMAVRVVVSDALSAHYNEHHSYPPSLSALPSQSLPWGDEGSSLSDLANWSYSSDGSIFAMKWTNALGTELFLGGRTGHVFFFKDESI